MASSETDGHLSEEQPKLSKKAAKEEEAKLEKLHCHLEASVAISAAASPGEEDPLATSYEEVPLSDLQSKEEVGEPYTEVGVLSEEMKASSVLVRGGRAQAIRAVGKKMAFVVVREKGFTVQCVVTEQEGSVSRQMVKLVASLNRESIVDVHSTLTVPSSPIKGASQQVEIQVNRLYCVSKALPTLPINLEDAAHSEANPRCEQRPYF